MPGVVFSPSNDGHVRAYAAADGRVLWDFDTMREFQTVNGAKAHGGSIDGPGVVAAGGMLFVTSGYSRNGGVPGNVLLAFGPEVPSCTSTGRSQAETTPSQRARTAGSRRYRRRKRRFRLEGGRGNQAVRQRPSPPPGHVEQFSRLNSFGVDEGSGMPMTLRAR
jgi:hypothetical protein